VILLQRVENREYPKDYLLSRIRGKRACLISDWTSLIYGGDPFEYLSSSFYRGFLTEKSPEGLWRDLLKEYRWVYFRMTKELLRIFSPFFLYCELRTIFICLRYIGGGKTIKAGVILSPSLLSEEIKRSLMQSKDIASAVLEIEKSFLELSDAFGGVADTFGRDGLQGFQRDLTVRYLLTTLRSGTHPLMKNFFARIIDSRNIIALYKFLRLNPKAAPSFIPEGTISESAFTGIIERKDMVEIFRLAGITDKEPGRPNIESALYRNISVFLRKAGRYPLGIGPVLDYLWRCEREVMNLGILSFGREIDRETIKAELAN